MGEVSGSRVQGQTPNLQRLMRPVKLNLKNEKPNPEEVRSQSATADDQQSLPKQPLVKGKIGGFANFEF